MNIAKMNKQELAGVLAAIALQTKAIEQRKKEIEEESLKNSSLLCDGGILNSHIQACGFNGFRAYENHKPHKGSDYNIFQDSDTAQAYAEAFNTMLGLRHCKGSVKAVDDVIQCLISDNGCIGSYYSLGVKQGSISPCYATEQDAINAIETVGKEAIIKMFNTLSGN